MIENVLPKEITDLIEGVMTERDAAIVRAHKAEGQVDALRGAIARTAH